MTLQQDIDQYIEAYRAYTVEKKQFENEHPFEFETALTAPTFRDITERELTGLYLLNLGLTQALVSLAWDGANGYMTDEKRAVLVELSGIVSDFNIR